jgi:hypothetical protein
MRMDFQTTRQTVIAKVYPMWCYEECVARHLARLFPLCYLTLPAFLSLGLFGSI